MHYLFEITSVKYLLITLADAPRDRLVGNVFAV